MYKVTLIIDGYTRIDDKLKNIEIEKKGKCSTWDDVETFLACQVGAFGSVKCVIEEVRV